MKITQNHKEKPTKNARMFNLNESLEKFKEKYFFTKSYQTKQK